MILEILQPCPTSRLIIPQQLRALTFPARGFATDRERRHAAITHTKLRFCFSYSRRLGVDA